MSAVRKIDTLPPASELFTRRQLVERHPNVLNDSRVLWAARNRHENGLVEAGAIFDSPCGESIYHEPSFLRWFLGLTSRSKPRRLRNKSSVAA